MRILHLAVYAVIFVAAHVATPVAAQSPSAFLVALDGGASGVSINVVAEPLTSLFNQCPSGFDAGEVYFHTGEGGRLLMSVPEGGVQKFGFGILPNFTVRAPEWCSAVESFVSLAETPVSDGPLIVDTDSGVVGYTDGRGVVGSMVLSEATGEWEVIGDTIAVAENQAFGQHPDDLPPRGGMTALMELYDTLWYYYGTGDDDVSGALWQNTYFSEAEAPPRFDIRRLTGDRSHDIIAMARVRCPTHEPLGLIPGNMTARQIVRLVGGAVIYTSDLPLKGLKGADNCIYYAYDDHNIVSLHTVLRTDGQTRDGIVQGEVVLHTDQTIIDIEPLRLSGDTTVLPNATEVIEIEVCGPHLPSIPLPGVDFIPSQYVIRSETFAPNLQRFWDGLDCETVVYRDVFVPGDGVEQTVNHTTVVTNIGVYSLVAPSISVECRGNLTLGLVYPAVDTCGGTCALWEANITVTTTADGVEYAAADPCGGSVAVTVPVVSRDTRPPAVTPPEVPGACGPPLARVTDECDGTWEVPPAETNATLCEVSWHWEACDLAGNCGSASATRALRTP